MEICFQFINGSIESLHINPYLHMYVHIQNFSATIHIPASRYSAH